MSQEMRYGNGVTLSGDRRPGCFCALCLALLLLTIPAPAFPHGDLNLPEPASPEEYGDVFMDRVSTTAKMTPVVFSHWVHRPKYTCRVCHLELEFAMTAEETAIICEKGTMRGRYCSVCHNGSTAFGPRGDEGENCKRCHNANTSPNRDKFSEMIKNLPRDGYGNGVNWSKALDEGLIRPKASLSADASSRPIRIGKTLELRAEMSGIPPAVFPHKTHEQWLDCSNCHPEIFNIKKKTTKHFSMERMLKGEFCGTCHFKIAFPLNDCRRCHPAIRR